jgi:FkbM family methyltransferase
MALNSSILIMNLTAEIERSCTRSPQAHHCSRCAAEQTRSQWGGEDRIMLPTLMQAAGGKRGLFVELGALDGVRLSNTYMLEACFGWRGLLIEANSLNYEQLLRSNRTHSKFVHRGICPGVGPNRTVLISRHGDEISGQMDAMTARHKYKWRMELNKNGGGVEPVPCATLPELMEEHGLASGATFLSLDVEGAEEIVLRTAFPALPFDAVYVEVDGTNPAKDARVGSLLRAAGLQLLYRFRVAGCQGGGCSDFYLRNPAAQSN